MSGTILRDDFDRFHDYGCLIKSRDIYFGSDHNTLFPETDGEGGVDFVSTATLIKNLLYLDEQKEEKITIHFNSPGGDWTHGMAIFDFIKSRRSLVSFIGYGCVRSMGTIIMQACDERYLTHYCRFMIHVGTEEISGHSEDVHRASDEGRLINEQMYDIYLEKIRVNHPRYSREKIKDLCSHDTYMSADEAVALGLADKVLRD